jgi:hypothetical protein
MKPRMSPVTRLLFASLVLTGCGDAEEERFREETADALKRMGEFRDEMCKCQDKPCTDRVQQAMTRWSTDMAAKSSDRRREHKADEATMKKMTEVGQAYGECMTKAMSQPGATPEPVATPAAPPILTPTADETKEPATPKAPLYADALLRQVRDWAHKQRPDRFVESAAFSYVDAEGLLDATDGEVRIVFGRVNDSSSKRRVGGRVRPKQPQSDCFTLQTTGGRWLVTTNECADTVDYVPRCGAAAIWKRAIAKKAPGEAVAQLTFHANEKKWDFAIDDEPLKVHVRESFPDDCELNVER